MKKLVSLFATIMALVAVACGGDDVDKPAPKPGPEQPSNPDAAFVVDITATTRGSVTFSVTPKDPIMDYLCIVYEKAEADTYRKDEFIVNDIFAKLEQVAQKEGKLLGEYLPKVLQYGTTEGNKATGLSMNTEHYIIVFGVEYTANGYVASTELVKKTFKTEDVEKKNVTFDVDTHVVFNSVEFTIYPSDKEILYYICTMPVATYNGYVGEDENQMSQGEFYRYYFQNEINSMLQSGNTAEQTIMALIHDGDLRIGASGLDANTDYCYLIAGLAMDEDGIVVNTDITYGTYTTGDAAPTDLYFNIRVYDVQQMSVSFTVHPSNSEDKYVCLVQPYDGVSTAEEIMNDMVEQWGPGWMSVIANSKGDLDFVTKPVALPAAGIEYCIIAFGYEGGITSDAYMEKFTTLPGGKIEDVEFSVTASNVTAYGLTLNVQSSDPTIYYAASICTKEEYNEELFIQDVNDGFDYYNAGTLDFDPTTIVAEVLDQYYSNGSQAFSSSGLLPNTEYMAYVYALDINTGHVAKCFTFDNIARTSSVGTVHPQVKLVGYYSGDDEAGKVFGVPEVTAGKAIAVLTYDNYDDASSLYALTIQGEGNDYSDLSQYPDAVMWGLTANLSGWVSCDLASPYTFCVVDWNSECFALAYALDQNGMTGRIDRLSIIATAENKSDINELVDLYFGLYPKDEETRGVVAPSLVVVE